MDGILFAKEAEKKPPLPEEEEDSEEEESEEESSENTPDEEEEQKNLAPSMLYSPTRTRDSFMQKISASTPKGTPVDQLEKRLALLKY